MLPAGKIEPLGEAVCVDWLSKGRAPVIVPPASRAAMVVSGHSGSFSPPRSPSSRGDMSPDWRLPSPRTRGSVMTAPMLAHSASAPVTMPVPGHSGKLLPIAGHSGHEWVVVAQGSPAPSRLQSGTLSPPPNRLGSAENTITSPPRQSSAPRMVPPGNIDAVGPPPTSRCFIGPGASGSWSLPVGGAQTRSRQTAVMATPPGSARTPVTIHSPKATPPGSASVPVTIHSPKATPPGSASAPPGAAKAVQTPPGSANVPVTLPVPVNKAQITGSSTPRGQFTVSTVSSMTSLSPLTVSLPRH